jgi:hypothetical protein
MEFAAKKLFSLLTCPGDPGAFEFHLGYITGVSVSIAVILAILIVRIISVIIMSSSGRAKGIMLPAPSGTLFVSARAITDLIYSLEPEFPFVRISRVTLLDKKKFFTVDIVMSIDIKGGDLSLMSSELQSKILMRLKETFGISNIQEVNIHVKTVETSRENRD